MKVLRDSVWMPSLNRHRREALRRIDDEGLQVPTLVAWGFDDPSAPLVQGHRLFTRICRSTEQASMHIFNRAGHPVFREQPEAFNRMLLAYCQP